MTARLAILAALLLPPSVVWAGAPSISVDPVRSRLVVNGQDMPIVEMGSPENRVAAFIADREAETRRIQQLASLGINTVWFSAYNTESGQPELWITDANASEFREFVLTLARYNITPHMIVSERENHFRFANDGDRRAHYRRCVAAVSGVPAIIGWEELNPGAHVGGWLAMLREEIASANTPAIVSMHNWPGEQPWRNGTPDIIAFQGAEAWEIAGLPRPAYLAEKTPFNVGIPPDNAGGLPVALEWYWGAWPASLGAGIYAGYQWPCNDLGCDDPEGAYGNAIRGMATSAWFDVRDQDATGVRLLGWPVEAAVTDHNSDVVIDAADLIFYANWRE